LTASFAGGCTAVFHLWYNYAVILFLRSGLMVDPKLLEILRCPACVKEKPALLTLVKDAWLVCSDCGRKYPIVEDIPVMLIEEGDKWIATAVDSLPVPPPRPA